MLAGALGRGDRTVVTDPNGAYVARFGRKGDVVLNPFDVRSVSWSIFNEIDRTYDIERYARSVIPDARSAQDNEWHGYTRLLFRETAARLIALNDNSTAKPLHWLTAAKIEDLEHLVEETPAVGLFDKGATKALSSTRFILTNYLNPHQHLKPGEFSLRRWLESGKGSLYVTWREDSNTVTYSERPVRERAVIPSEIHKLQELTGYLKLAGDYPIAEVKPKPLNYPVHNKAIVEAVDVVHR